MSNEPVAWNGYDLDAMCEAFSRCIEAQHHKDNPFQDPINADAMTALRILRGFVPAMKAYTHPPQRKPLTDEEIELLAVKHTPPIDPAFAKDDEFIEFARAVERAHGIGGEA